MVREARVHPRWNFRDSSLAREEVYKMQVTQHQVFVHKSQENFSWLLLSTLSVWLAPSVQTLLQVFSAVQARFVYILLFDLP